MKKIAWLVVSGWVVAALLLASCAPAAVKEPEKEVVPPKKVETPKKVVEPKEVVEPEKGPEMVKWTGKKLDGTVVEKMIEKPRYGGTLTTFRETQPVYWNRTLGVTFSVWNLNPTNEPLFTRDWTRGPGGTEEWSGQVGTQANFWNRVGELGAGWELPDTDTIIVHVRRGVHWALDPDSEASRMVGGREMTAQDIVDTLVHEWSNGYHKRTMPYLVDMKDVTNSIYVSPDNKWDVIFKLKPKKAWVILERLTPQFITASEWIDEYKDVDNWRNVVGTGAFILKDYVGGSSITYAKNPNYWDSDPFFPDNKVPYIDTLKVLIIPDISTQQAALRTGQIDNLWDLLVEDAQPLLSSNPELERVKYINGVLPNTMIPRNDIPPFNDVLVRRAMMMGFDHRAIVEQFYGGEAELWWPVPPIPGFDQLYIPPEEMPESVQELWGYHPEKAKQLLAEAGYPDGFQTSILTFSQDQIDIATIAKDQWAKIGIDLEIDVRPYPVYIGLRTRKTYPQMTWHDLNTQAMQSWQSAFLIYLLKGRGPNYAMVTDSYYVNLQPEVHDAIALDPNEGQFVKNREYQIYVNENIPFIPMPGPYRLALWQPWLKGYYGTTFRAHPDTLGYAKYAWIDQKLKAEMGR